MNCKRDEADKETIDWVEQETGDEYKKPKKGESY
jgi:hypothetical protein